MFSCPQTKCLVDKQKQPSTNISDTRKRKTSHCIVALGNLSRILTKLYFPSACDLYTTKEIQKTFTDLHFFLLYLHTSFRRPREIKKEPNRIAYVFL